MQFITGTNRREGGIPYKWLVVIVVIFGSFMSILDQTVVNNALPRLQTAFGVDFNSLQWVITAYTLTQGVVTPTTAFFANRLGTKRFYVIALAFFTLGSALCGIAWNLPSLILFRVVQAIGGATLFPLAITLLFTEFPPQQRGLATGILSVSALMAPAIGPTFGGYIVTYADWPLIFYINVPVGIIAIVMALLLLREHTSASRVYFDLPGFVFAAIGLTAILYAISNATISGWSSPYIILTLIGGLCALLLFVFIELNTSRRGKQPLVDVRLFANGPFLSSNIANALISFGFFGSLILFPIYTQELRGLDAFQSGLLTLPLPFTAVLAAIIGGRIVDRFGPRVVLFPGLVFMGLSTWQLALITPTTSYTWFLLILALRGLGLGCLLQPLTVSALAKVPQSQYAQASSLNTVIRFVFTSLGIAILATVVQSRATVYTSDLAHQVGLTSHATLALIKQQGLNLALHDAFWLALVAFLVAFLAVGFIRVQKQRPQVKDAALEPAAQIVSE
ncbi:MFS transporter [Ktedonobacter sp. SOSP1-85]|uniref:MDR family MFS transporter n=1 Tax=Ktedonobacter sp. SOSP1-85 TaxID=2778367 RepID=UPI001915A644|nr:MDR family MFS transporter [Ktedonobacter sp. SOSP1-85]GHO80877.1 MFS transporter [Ktedonobacter sp. SOSP1-85]